MDPVGVRLFIAGTLVVVMGVAIAVTGASVGENPEIKGIIVGAMGLGLIVTGASRVRKPRG